MKKTLIKTSSIIILTILTILNFSSCEEKNEYFDWKAMNEDWFNLHKADEGFVQTESGLCYKVVRRGNTSDRKPNPTSYITATYKGRLIDGTVVSQGKDDPMGRLYNLIKGLQEGIVMMHTGDIYEFYVPYNLGYGNEGATSTIPPYSTLYFTVELIDSGL